MSNQDSIPQTLTRSEKRAIDRAERDALHTSFRELRDAARELSPNEWWLKQTELTTLGYEAIVYEIAGRIRATRSGQDAHILDWGGGPGFLSYLLESLGFTTTYYDAIYDSPSYRYVLERLCAEKQFLNDPVALPFHDESFDAVISCGVLEHVPDPAASLDELARVLRPDGLLFIYHFPNRWSWTEAVAERLGRPTHDVRWTRAELTSTVRAAGFEIDHSDFRYLVPRNLIGFHRLNRFVSKHAGTIYRADRIASRMPGLRNAANALNLVAVKPR